MIGTSHLGQLPVDTATAFTRIGAFVELVLSAAIAFTVLQFLSTT